MTPREYIFGIYYTYINNMLSISPNNRLIRIYIKALKEIAYINPVYSKYILRHIDIIILDL